MADKPMMKCGHAANSTDGEGKPVCVICFGLKPGAAEVADEPDLEGREAKCTYCSNKCPSSTNLAFFEHRPDRPSDSYYCGCFGWD